MAGSTKSERRKLGSWKATWLFLMMTISQSLALNTFYTVEYPAYSFPSQECTLVFTIEAPSTSSGPAPLSLTTVLDRSESMKGRKLDLLKKTNQYLVEVMKKNSGKHDLGIVTYSNLLNELVGLQPVTDNTGPLMNYLIGNIDAAGTTYLSGGLAKGLEQQKNNPTDKVQAIYLFTDGLPNIGSTSSWDIINEIRAIRDHVGHHISIYTFGFGDDLDANLLWDIAHEGNGVAYIIANEDDIPRAFGDAIGGLLSSVAQDVKVTFKPKDGARIKTIESPGEITVLSDGSVEVRLSDLFAQETRDILVTVEAPETSYSGFQNLLYVDTTYKDAVTRKVTGQDTVYVGINRESNPVVVVPAERVEVVKIYYITSKVLEEAGEKAENGDDNGAKEKFEEAEKAILQSPLQNRPRLSGLLNDIRKVREAVVDKALTRARSGGILRNLVSTIRDQRGSSTSTDQLETASALDTDSKKEQREEASQGVLGDRAFAVAPAPPGPLLGPVGQAVGGAIADRLVDRITGSDSDNDNDGDNDSDDNEEEDDNSDEDTNDDQSNDSGEDSNDDQSSGSSEDNSEDQSNGSSEDNSEDQSNGSSEDNADNESNIEGSDIMAADESEDTGSAVTEATQGSTEEVSDESDDSSDTGGAEEAFLSDTSSASQEPLDNSESDGSENTSPEESTSSDDNGQGDDSSESQDEPKRGEVVEALVDAAQQLLSTGDEDTDTDPAESSGATDTSGADDSTTEADTDSEDPSATESETEDSTTVDESNDAEAESLPVNVEGSEAPATSPPNGDAETSIKPIQEEVVPEQSDVPTEAQPLPPVPTQAANGTTDAVAEALPVATESGV